MSLRVANRSGRPDASSITNPGEGALSRTSKVTTASAWAIVSALGVLVIVYFGVVFPAVAVAVIGLMVAVLAPMPTFVASTLWIIICRPGAELMQATVGSIHLTEVDVLPVVSTVAAISLSRATGKRSVRLSEWLALLAWPLWFAVRFAMPPLGATDFGSPVVDARNATMYVVIVPIAIFVARRGWRAGLSLLCYGGYIACGIAIVAWATLATGLSSPMMTAVVNSLALNDVRPGGEILVVMLAVLLALGKAPLIGGSRVVSLAIVAAELLASQTLSMFIAIVVGITLAAAVQWSTLRLGQRLIVAVLALLFLGLAVGGVAAGSRFDLLSRIDQASAQNRVNEFGLVTGVLFHDPLVASIGTGPGSLLHVDDLYSGLVDVKRDTHDSFANIAFKSGLLGLLLYLVPILMVFGRLVRTRRPYGRPLAATIAAVCALSVTVPFIWTASGFTALALLLVVGLAYLNSDEDTPGRDALSAAFHESSAMRRSPTSRKVR